MTAAVAISAISMFLTVGCSSGSADDDASGQQSITFWDGPT